MKLDIRQIKEASRATLPDVILGLIDVWETPEQVKRDCAAIVQARIDRCKSKELRGKQNAASSDLTSVRKAVKALDVAKIPENLQTKDDRGVIVHLAYNHLKISFSKDEQRIDADKRASNRHEKRANSKPFDFESWFNLAELWIESSDPIEAGFAVLIATGRRPSEVWGTTEFRALDKNRCWVRGIAKKRGEAQKECFIVPTFIDSESIVAAIELIRQQLPPSEWIAEGKDFNQSDVYRKVKKIYDIEFRPAFAEQGFEENISKNFRYLYESVVRELASMQFGDRFEPSEYAARALSHQDEGSVANYSIFKIESVPSELTLPSFEEIGSRGIDPVDSPFSTRVTFDLEKLFERIDHHVRRLGSQRSEAIRSKVSELMQAGSDVEDAIAIALLSSEGKATEEVKPSKHEMARDDVEMVIDAMIEHNQEANQNGDYEVCITFTSVQRVLKAWKDKRLAASLWNRIYPKKQDEIRENHALFGCWNGNSNDESNLIKNHSYSIRGDKMGTIVDQVVSRLNNG
ncbi:hypothetical protein C7B61_00285 [filamentous cyanobacterium CCP1]|nr:hypothetical protein C7B76_16775 [filamentous cyanobacterium CCP2]PSB68536.1 hypothetical protein C7B61_00285 [filamentous cyanobacterium CCP1]